MRYDDDHAFWASYLAASIATAVRNIEDEFDPADVAIGLRRDLTAYLTSSPGQPVRHLLQDRMDGRDSTESASNETDAVETEMR